MKLTLKTPLSLQAQQKLTKMTGEDKEKSQQEPSPAPNTKQEAGHKDSIAALSPVVEEIAAARARLEAAINWLETTFPQTFNFASPKPLELRIDRKIMTCVPEGLAKNQVKKALKVFVDNPAYREAIITSSHRYDLNGQPCSAIPQEHKDHARRKLKTIIL